MVLKLLKLKTLSISKQNHNELIMSTTTSKAKAATTAASKANCPHSEVERVVTVGQFQTEKYIRCVACKTQLNSDITTVYEDVDPSTSSNAAWAQSVANCAHDSDPPSFIATYVAKPNVQRARKWAAGRGDYIVETKFPPLRPTQSWCKRCGAWMKTPDELLVGEVRQVMSRDLPMPKK